MPLRSLLRLHDKKEKAGPFGTAPWRALAHDFRTTDIVGRSQSTYLSAKTLKADVRKSTETNNKPIAARPPARRPALAPSSGSGVCQVPYLVAVFQHDSQSHLSLCGWKATTLPLLQSPPD